MVKIRHLMTVIIFLPFLNPSELARFCQLDKECYKLLLIHVNFKVLFEAWGFKLTKSQLELTRISISRTLKTAAKFMMINAIDFDNGKNMGIRSLRKIKCMNHIPNLATLAKQSFEALRKLTLQRVDWNEHISVSFTLSDGQSCSAGKNPFI